MPHVDDGTLHALLDGALRAEDPEGAAAVERHLAACEDCRARLDDAAGLRDGARSILDDAAPAAAAPVPDFSEVQARAGARPSGAGATAGGTRRRMATQASWTRRAAWAASLVVALGTGYLLRDLAGPPEPTAETRLMAPDAARDETPPGEASPSPEDGVVADRGGAADGQADGRADGAAGVANGVSPAPIADTPTTQGQLAAEEETTVARGAEALEERRAAEDLVTAQRARQLSATGADAPSNITAAPEAGPGQEPALAVPEVGETEAYRWSSVELEEARRSLEGPVYVLPRATILELYASADTAAPRVMSRQQLASGILVEVVQWRGEDERPTGAVEAQAEKAAGPDTGERPGLPPPEVVRVVRGPFLLQVTASLPGELLAILAESATPAP